MTFKRVAAFAGAGLLALGVVSCSSGGGAPEQSGDGAGGACFIRKIVIIGLIVQYHINHYSFIIYQPHTVSTFPAILQ